MGVAPPSATAMVKKLAALGLVDHELYRGVRLTRNGERIALELLRHHRLLELYLAQTLELGLDAVHAEADRLEHALSETLETLIDEALGSPTHDPHGDPIPDAKLRIVHPKGKPLSRLAAREGRDRAEGSRRRRRAAPLPDLAGPPSGSARRAVRAEPFGGPLTIRVKGRETVISRQLGDQIHVLR